MTLAGLIGFGKIALYANFLSPIGLGAYSFSLLLLAYGISICSLGLYEGALGVFPVWYGQNFDCRVQTTRNQILGFLCFSGIIFCLLSSASLFLDSILPLNWLSILLVCAFSSVSTFFLVLLADIRSRLMTLQFGIFMLARGALSLIAGSLLARSYGYIGILSSEICITLFLTIILAVIEIEKIGFARPDFAALIPIFRIGFPLMLNGAVTNTASSIDRFFVIAALGTDAFGQYSFAMIIASGGAMLQAILYQQIGPEILYKVGQGLSAAQILKKVNRFIFALFLLAVICAYPTFYAAHRVIPLYFSEYYQSLSIFPVVYIGATFSALSVYENFAVALGKTEYVLALNSLIICGVGFASYIFIQHGVSILTFASVYASGRLLYFLATLLMAFWAVNQLPRGDGI